MTLAEYFWLAEPVKGIEAAKLARASRIELAASALHAPEATFGGREFYEELAAKAAVLVCRLAWSTWRRLSGPGEGGPTGGLRPSGRPGKTQLTPGVGPVRYGFKAAMTGERDLLVTKPVHSPTTASPTSTTS